MSAVTAIFLDPAERYGRVYIYRNSFITLLSMTQLSTIKIIIIRDPNCDNLFKKQQQNSRYFCKIHDCLHANHRWFKYLLESNKIFPLFYYSVKCPSIKRKEFSFGLVLWLLSQLIDPLLDKSIITNFTDIIQVHCTVYIQPFKIEN